MKNELDVNVSVEIETDKNVAMTIECVKVYYIKNIELAEEIDKVIKKFKKDGGGVQTLDDGETNPPKPPKNP